MFFFFFGKKTPIDAAGRGGEILVQIFHFPKTIFWSCFFFGKYPKIIKKYPKNSVLNLSGFSESLVGIDNCFFVRDRSI